MSDSVRWTFDKDMLKGLDPIPDQDKAIFTIKPRTFRDSLFTQYQNERGSDFEEYAANKVYNHIAKIEVNGTTHTKPDDIAGFINDLEEQRGLVLQLAIMRRQGYLEQGTLKN